MKRTLALGLFAILAFAAATRLLAQNPVVGTLVSCCNSSLWT
jgi:hypothetical protein